MKYLILIHSNPASRALWETMSDEQRWEFGKAHYALTDRLTESGDLISSAGLTDPEMGVQVSVRDGVTVASDGPFPEVKEYLAGFYLVECESIDKAVELAAMVPDALTGSVEVRPVFDQTLLDL